MTARKTSPLLVAFITVAIDLLGFGIIMPLLPRYGQTFAETLPAELVGPTVGLLLASFSAMQFLFAPWWGKLSDRIGRRPVLIVGLAGSVGTYLLFGYATLAGSLVLLFVARTGQGIAGATIATAQAVIADCTPPEQRARGMALIGMAFGIGFTFGPIVGAFWVSDSPTGPPSAAPGFIAAGLSFAALCFALWRLPETLRTGGAASRRPLFDLAGLQLLLGHRATAIPLITLFVSMLAFGQLESTLARLTQDVLAFSDRQNFYVFAFIGFTLALAQGLLVRRLVPHVGEVVLVIAGIGLMLAGLAATGLAAVQGSLVLVLAALFLVVVGFACLTPSVQALISRRSSPTRQGEILGVTQSTGAIARILGPLMGNTLYNAQALLESFPEALTSPRPFPPALRYALPFLVGAALMAVALVLALTLRQDHPGAAGVESSKPR